MRIHTRVPFAVALIVLAGCHRHRVRHGGDPGSAGGPPAEQAPPEMQLQAQTQTQGSGQQPGLSAVGPTQALVRVTADQADETEPHLSPDGKIVVFVSSASAQDAKGNAITQTSIVGADPSNGSGRTIYTGTNGATDYPTWTPKGSLVYVSNATGTPALVHALTSAPNAAFRIITDGKMAKNPAYPCVAPDGRRIVFQATVAGTDSIVTIGADGSRLTVLGPGYAPSYSPDGKRIAFARAIGGAYEIMTMNAVNGGGLVQVTNARASSSKPKYSPDGRYIVFESSYGASVIPGGSPEATFNVFAVKPDGTSFTQLTTGAGESGMPFWGTDGFIYFESNQGGTSSRDIWRVQPTGDLASADAAVTPAGKSENERIPGANGGPPKW